MRERLTDTGRNAGRANARTRSRSQRYRIGEVARVSGTTARTLRYYEELGLIHPVARSAGKYRLYDRSTVDAIHLIKELRESGFALKDVRELMSAWANTSSSKKRLALLHNLLDGRLAQLGTRISRLQAVRKRLTSILERASECVAPGCKPSEDACTNCELGVSTPLQPLTDIAWKLQSRGIRKERR